MKYIKTINEMVKNHNLVKYYIHKLKKELDFLNIENIRVNNFNHTYEVIINPINKKNFKLINNILKRYKKIFLKIDYILGYKFFDHVDYYYLLIVVKNSKTIRIKPKRFVYHYSPVHNREEIIKNGLIPQKFSNSIKWKDTPGLEYEDAIFAMNGLNKKWMFHKTNDCWKIDTLYLKNKWWLDLNLEDNDHIMTFESIPPEFIKLFNK